MYVAADEGQANHFKMLILAASRKGLRHHRVIEKVISEEYLELLQILVDCARDHLTKIGGLRKTALHRAVTLQATKSLTFLLKAGLDVNQRDFIRQTPLHLAAKYNRPEMVKQLLLYDANPLLKTIGGKTPSQLAPKGSRSLKMLTAIEALRKAETS